MLKRVIKIVSLIFISVILLWIGLILYAYYTNEIYKRNCPPFNQESLKWLPYEKDEIIEFKNDSLIETYIVEIRQINHRDEYSTRYANGCCEEGVMVRLRNTKNSKDSITINIENLYNDQTCFGKSISINDHFFYAGSGVIPIKDTIIKNTKLQYFNAGDSLVVAKSLGIISIKKNNMNYYRYK